MNEKREQETVIIDNVIESFPRLGKIVGIRGYPWRSLVIPGERVINCSSCEEEKQLDDYLSYLNENGIGAGLVIKVTEDRILEHIVRNPEIAKTIEQKKYLSLFFMNSELERILPKGWKKKFDLPSIEACEKANDKADFRKTMEKLNLGELMPINFIVDVFKEGIKESKYQIREAVEQLSLCALSSDFRFYVVKESGLASGEGIYFFYTKSEALKKANELVIELFEEKEKQEKAGIKKIIDPKIIIEAGYRKQDDFSMKWTLSRQDGIIFQGFSLQLIETDNKTHKGNIIMAKDNFVPGLREDELIMLEEKGRKIVEHYVKEGYISETPLDFVIDFIKSPSGHLYLLEAGARRGNSTYLRFIKDQLEDFMEYSSTIAVAMRDCHPSKKIKNWFQLKKVLAERIFSLKNRKGVIPVAPNCLKYGKLFLVGVSKDFSQAQNEMEESCKLVERY